MAILTLNSHVAYGYVGNSAAVFALRRLGLSTWPVHTVELSNHPGYGAYTGRIVPAAEIRELVDGLAAREVLGRCTAVLSGYLGAADQGDEVLRAVAAVRAARPAATYVLDPVMGDAGPGLYVAPDIVTFFRDHAVPTADVVTPNAFELATLTGMPVTDVSAALTAARALMERGPRRVVATSLDLDRDTLGVLAATADGDAWLARVPRLVFPIPPNGAGDLLSALLTAHLSGGESLPTALGRAVDAVDAILRTTLRTGGRELALLRAQDALICTNRAKFTDPHGSDRALAPPRRVSVETLAE